MEKKMIITVAITALVAFSAGAGAVLIQQPKNMNDDTMSHDTSSMNMSSDMSMMSSSLKGLKGDEFDKKFISEMITHHEGAVDMAELALTNAKHQEVKTMAQNIISAQTKEIDEMQTWQKNWNY
jgi:uncharacterized protein (DUF305 family)